MDPGTGLFVLASKDSHMYIPNPNATHDIFHVSAVDAFKAVGRFVGRALLDGQMLPLPFSPAVFKAILGVPLTLEDVEVLDPSVYSSLRYILEHDDIDALALTFSITERRGDRVDEVDLIPRGRCIDVTDANKADYVDLMLRYLLYQRFERYLLELVQGVYDIVPPELLVPFDHKELELLLCGLADIDVQDWKAHTECSTNVAGSPLVEWFWDIVAAMTPAERATLLQYTTGSSRVPVQGFRGLTSHDGRICRFSLKGVTYIPGAYPTVHACFNRIDLPLYPRKDLLVEALQMLLLSNPTGFDIA
ncbi:hypothetical protein H310_04296 [Aphanomyces invadans]|uniref:HECT-type E3 ubiquitin transferase n=1 Tax=Aphanomyces invadans TaxID=157072 RepID=A0A024UGH0_9STRA|nr:hypothetical protein H310_04296 [Aphanomyces invadans]ETW05374.1 hypothetical protein H310_04296 [Aphanomyces invadans]|eukprot:XP_008866812.1 hypothetical protein H310_04296 [Aphanomyces invadans]